jgi:hydrogenase-4 component F
MTLVAMAPAWFDPVVLVPGLPLLGAILVAIARDARAGALIVIGAAAAGLAAACQLPAQMEAGLFLLVDPLSAHLAMLTAFVGLTTALISRPYIAHELATGRLDAGRVQTYHTLFLSFLGFMLLALLSNNLGVSWVALEAATISAVLVVGLPRTDVAIEASWKFFILCGVGIALAFFGTVVLYLAALPALGPGYGAMTWTELARAAPNCRATLLNLAFVFLLVGYGTKAGLAPLHSWMPDAHAEGPTPVSAVLAGSVLNVALLLILRLRGVMASNPQAIDPGPPIMVLGLLSVLLAAFSLWGRRDAKRFFAFSSIEQSGLAAFAIGLGGVTATFAALLHMTVHTLAKAAVYQSIGRASQRKGGQKFTDIVGLIASDRALGLTLAAAIIAVAGLPPFGLFASEVLILSATMRQQPFLVPLLVLGLLVGGWKLLARLISLCLGPPTLAKGPAAPWTSLLPTWVHLAIVAVLGFAMPASIAAWLVAAAQVVP